MGSVCSWVLYSGMVNIHHSQHFTLSNKLCSIYFLADNQILAARSGVIEVTLGCMKRWVSEVDKNDNIYPYEEGCRVLCYISGGNSSIQRHICERGGLIILLKILKRYDGNQGILEACCGAIEGVLSSQETRTEFLTKNVLGAVQEFREGHKRDGRIQQLFLSLKELEDPRVLYSIEEGKCTNEAYPKCREECGCEEGVYCIKCCVQQRMFRCYTCDRTEVKFYCEVCWKRDHEFHLGKTFFFPGRCATKKK